MSSDESAARPRRRRNPRGEGARLRDELVEAASDLIAEHGSAEGVSIRAVARRAGVSAPSVYLHFDDRDALISAVLVQRFADLGDAVVEGIEAAGGDASPFSRLVAGCHAYIAYGLGNPGHYRVLFGTPVGPFSPTMSSAAAESLNLLVEGIARCEEAGAAIAGTPLDVATIVWSSLHGQVMLRVVSPSFPWPPVDAMLLPLLRGLVRMPDVTAGG
ncbi:MAG: TetR/AcrR family transcriptional regulator [Thermoleophilia bacterium]|nr:TetR/AcrR family transcriptional regulator [Thermoleophilia bacterium]